MSDQSLPSPATAGAAHAGPAGAPERPTSPVELLWNLVLGATLPLLTAVGMWWTYFDRTADAAQERLRRHADPVLAAADAYSYLHLVIIAGMRCPRRPSRDPPPQARVAARDAALRRIRLLQRLRS